MSKVLFVDACARGWEVSRTYAVAEAFMNAYREQHPRDEIEELTLAGLGSPISRVRSWNTATRCLRGAGRRTTISSWRGSSRRRTRSSSLRPIGI